MLHEQEIVSCLRENIREAITKCREIATQPLSGDAFSKLRENLKLIEGACRQMGYWRQDSRWLQPGRHAEAIHQRARGFLHHPSVVSKKLFIKLGDLLQSFSKECERLLLQPSKRRGTIIMKPAYLARKGGFIQVPANMRRTRGGILLPT